MNNTVYINRPWNSSFDWASVAYSDAKLEQVHKLVRNYVASLDLGCPHVRHAPDYPGLRAGMNEAERYKLWVQGWKRIYAEVSSLIRQQKTHRRTVRFPELSAEQCRQLTRAKVGDSQLARTDHMQGLAERHLARLQESAQVLLNARYNAKLAAAEARRRSLAAKNTASPAPAPVQQAA